jgi:hypothetical protein
MKKAFLTALILSVLLISTTGAHLDMVKANPFMYESDGEVSPPYDVKPPTISISSIKNDTVYNASRIFLNFTVEVVIPTLPELFYYWLYLSEVYCKASWLSNNTYLNLEAVKDSIPAESRTHSDEAYKKWHTYWQIDGHTFSHCFSVELSDVPNGVHSIEVFAVERGSRETSRSLAFNPAPIVHYGTYTLHSSSIVEFTIDTTPPNISNLSLTNKTYNFSVIPLNFNINETAQISYRLDDKANTLISGNTTLTELPEGTHYITLYANDTAGNMGKSDTVFFTVNTATPSPSATPTQQPTTEPSPTSSPVETEKAGYSGLGSDTVLIAVTLLTVAALVGVAVAFKIRRR